MPKCGASSGAPGWRHALPGCSHGQLWRHRRLEALDAEESIKHMDIEQINAIGTLLADLSQRTEQLRGYL